jgi:quercetin dioxygenase-like cupin family protein
MSFHLMDWAKVPWEPVRRGMQRKCFTGDGATLALHRIEPGHDLLPHAHHYEQIVYLLEGSAIFHVEGKPHELGPGSLIVIPPNVKHYIEVTGKDVVLELDVFTPKRPEYGG